jgi:NAD-dependent dihydropyrimidine dehydrogenase PreA subunit
MMRDIIEIDEEKCNGCGNCIPKCSEGALAIINGKAKLVDEIYCDGLGACLGICPQDAIKIITREAKAFDEKATHIHMQKHKSNENEQGTQTKTSPIQWPTQLNLVPIKASFYDNANLLLTADCVPVVYPKFHEKILNGKTVLLGCPKFDDVNLYIEKLREIIKQNKINSITTIIMEVPCCSFFKRIAELALEGSGKIMSNQNLIISVKGEII